MERSLEISFRAAHITSLDLSGELTKLVIIQSMTTETFIIKFGLDS